MQPKVSSSTGVAVSSVQLFVIAFFGAAGAFAPGLCFYLLCEQMSGWASPIKIGTIFLGGGITAGLTILLGIVGIAVGTCLAELLYPRA